MLQQKLSAKLLQEVAAVLGIPAQVGACDPPGGSNSHGARVVIPPTSYTVV